MLRDLKNYLLRAEERFRDNERRMTRALQRVSLTEG